MAIVLPSLVAAKYNSVMDSRIDPQGLLPSISVIIPTLNESRHIVGALESLFNGNYPISKLEVLIVDACSDDQTRQLARDCAKLHDANLQILDNPKKIVPAALNLGISGASNEILVWIGAHAKYHDDYLVESVNTLINDGCASAGGVIRPVGESNTGKAIAAATSTPFGIGNAKYRYADTKQNVDTVFGGCWRKQDALAVGGFNEKWVRNQDYEFNSRLRKQIGNIVLNPKIQCQYFCRGSLSALAKQYYQYGYWRYKTFREHPDSFGIRQFAPLALLLGLIASIVLSILGSKLAYVIPILYALVNLMAATHLGIKHRSWAIFVRAPFVFATLHLSWPIGFIRSALDAYFKP